MNLEAWLREHAAAPPQLNARILEVMGDRLDDPSERADGIFVEGAAHLLADVVARPAAGRESALDLLTVDALVTYAFEAASATPGLLPGRASQAMRRLALLAAP